MFNEYFYHGLLKKYVIYFGNLFNDIVIRRTDSNDQVIQEMTVPIMYSPKQRFIARLEQDPTLNREFAINLPRIGFEITGFAYDSNRKLQTMNRIVKQDTVYNNRLASTYVPVPYNLSFALSVYSKNADDGLKILEQILPFFTPEWTSTLNLVPELGISLDIPVVLTNVNMSDSYAGSLHADGTTRYIIHTLNFTLKGYFFGPSNSSTGIIKRAIVNMYNSTANREAELTLQSFITNFKVGDFVYQYDGKRQYASGTVNFANSTYLQLKNVIGQFSTANNLLTTNSNAVGIVSNVASIEVPNEVITIQPAMLANGNPTTDLTQSVSLDLINSDSDYGISVNITGD